MHRKLVIGNWKMNGSLQENAALLKGLVEGMQSEVCDVGVCVPFPYLNQSQQLLTGSSIAWGAQDVSVKPSGAYTGEVSATMLSEFDATFAIVGHSERRAYHCETDDVVAHKAKAALSAGLVPVVCVGETLAEREGDLTNSVVSRQLDAVLRAIDPSLLDRVVIAYEPVWAIGTGKTATPEAAQQVHAFIRARLSEKNPDAASVMRILYGGSMKPDNARDLMRMADVDGGLIGGASLNANDFLSIISAA